MSTNRPAPSAQIVAIAATLALIVTTFAIALAAFAAGAYPHRPAEGPVPDPASQSETPEAPAREAGHEAAEPSSAGLLDPSVGRGADSKVCAASPRSPRCRLEGGGGMSYTRGGHARPRPRPRRLGRRGGPLPGLTGPGLAPRPYDGIR